MTFDYAASAELFMPKRKLGARQAVSYRRFTTAAEAIRFAVEEFPGSRTLGASCVWKMIASTAMTSGAYTIAPVIRGAVACGNRGEICNRFRLKIVVADSAACNARDQQYR
jgi:hypothetical protein